VCLRIEVILLFHIELEILQYFCTIDILKYYSLFFRKCIKIFKKKYGDKNREKVGGRTMRK
jgi:hypothetical protein